jgi:molybdopterin converting factor subunit 1
VRLEILYFASAREAVGLPFEVLEAREGATVADVKALVTALHPALAAGWRTTRVAVGTRFARDDEPLGDGDRVALIPPVGGG